MLRLRTPGAESMLAGAKGRGRGSERCGERGAREGQASAPVETECGSDGEKRRRRRVQEDAARSTGSSAWEPEGGRAVL
jgi:hypothetical protein